jgi:antitoxin PrlF
MTTLEIEATVTERGQTTVPAPIRKALKIGKRDAIVFRLGSDGQVTVARKGASEPDPVIGQFLAFLAADMIANPQMLRPVAADWAAGLSTLVDGVEFDLDAKLPNDEP